MYAGEEGTDTLTRSTDAGRADWLTAEARLGLKLFSGNQLTFGLEGQGQLRVEQETFGDEGSEPLPTEARTLVSAYVLDEWRLHPRLSLSAGLRVDKYLDLDAMPLTPRLAVIARPYDAGLTKLVAGRAFRAPNVYELLYSDNLVTQRPAGVLDPETITTFEVEHAHDLTRELRLSVAGYHNRIENLVVLETDQRPVPQCGSPVGTAQCLVFQNGAGETLAWGAEAGLHWQPGRFLLVDLSYSYVTLEDAADEVAEATPAHLASARLLLPVPDSDMRLAAQAIYQSARPVGDGGRDSGEALLLGFGVSGDYGRLRYFAGVQNLLDERYVLPLGGNAAAGPVPQYGRTFTLQLTGTF
jgi:outer membrane receptor protein involved in Fe transport